MSRVRKAMIVVLVLWLTPVICVGSLGLGLPLAAAFPVAVGLAAALAAVLSRALHASLGRHLASRRTFAAAAVVAAVAAVFQIASLSVFMANVNHAAFSNAPADPFRVRHSCVSSYAEAARLVESGTLNIYDSTLYQPRQFGPLAIDPYHYPPPFLLVPQAVRVVAPDFWDFRAVWFALQALVLAGVLAGAAAWIGGTAGAVALVGGLIILALPHTMASLQQGNFQVTATPLAVAGLALLLTGRFPAGAALLAYTAAGKIFPGILVVYLVAARRWRPLAWVAAAGLALAALTLVVQGTRPAVDFVTHALPEISSGAAFPHSERPPTAPANWSVYGVTVRLRHLGLPWLTQPVGLRIASIYGVLVIGLAALAGWRTRLDLSLPAHRVQLLQVAVALVGLASFRSPFVGIVYGGVSTFWVMSLLAGGAGSDRTAAWWLAGLGALALAIGSLPSPGYPPSPMRLVISLVLFLATLGINLWAVGRAIAPRADRAHPVVGAAAA